MKKLIVISRCLDCPYFDIEYYTYNCVCDFLGKIEHEVDYEREIHKNCPLIDSQEELEELEDR